MITSCFEASECWLSLSATVVGGVEPEDAGVDEASVAGPENRLSTKRDMVSTRGSSQQNGPHVRMQRFCELCRQQRQPKIGGGSPEVQRVGRNSNGQKRGAEQSRAEEVKNQRMATAAGGGGGGGGDKPTNALAQGADGPEPCRRQALQVSSEVKSAGAGRCRQVQVVQVVQVRRIRKQHNRAQFSVLFFCMTEQTAISAKGVR